MADYWLTTITSLTVFCKCFLLQAGSECNKNTGQKDLSQLVHRECVSVREYYRWVPA